MQNQKAFSFVEIIITISIIVLLTVIGISSKQGYDENVNNTKVISDVITINNALLASAEENQSLPMPNGNTNFYSVDTTYSHSYEDTETFGVYGSITEETISKKFLDTIPLDPRTNSYYSYGKMKNKLEYEIASIQILDGNPTTKVAGNYTAETGPYNLIREYNGSNFVYDGSEVNLPYNPDELVMIVTDENGIIYREGDSISIALNGDVTKNFEPTILANEVDGLELYFSDGSVSVLETNSEITLNQLNFKSDNNLNTIVKLALGAGSIWTKATHLNDESAFEVYTTDSVASVRGTIFGVDYNAGVETTVTIKEGNVDVDEINYDNGGMGNPYEQLPIKGERLTTESELEVKKGEQAKIIKVQYNIRKGNIERIDQSSVISPDFKEAIEKRGTETSESIDSEIDNLALRSEELEEELGENSCILGGQVVENGDDIYAYSISTGASLTDCESHKINRNCIDGTLDGNIDYKYSSCTIAGPSFCTGPQTISSFLISASMTNTLDYAIGEKLVTNAYGSVTYKNKYECQSAGTFAFETQRPLIDSCTSGYVADDSINEQGCVAVICPAYSDGGFISGGSMSVGTITLSQSGPTVANGTNIIQRDVTCNADSSITESVDTTNLTCNSGYDPINGDSCITNNMGTPWTLEGYTSYDTINDFSIYPESGSPITPFYNQNVVHDGSSIFVSNTSPQNKLKYDLQQILGVGGSDEYVIEVNVKGSELYRNDNTYTLLATDGGVLVALLSGVAPKIMLQKSGEAPSFIDFISSDFGNEIYYKVKLIGSDIDTKLQIETDGISKQATVLASSNLTYLYTGSKSSFDWHWNGFFDYIKIYK